MAHPLIDGGRTARRRRFPFPFVFNSLRMQILLWIALPLVALILAISLSEVRGHQQVMRHMVQEQATTSAQAAAQLINEQIARRLNLLAHQGRHTQISDITTIPADPELALPIVVFDQSGPVLGGSSADSVPPWTTWPETAQLVDRVMGLVTPLALPVQGPDGWQIIYAAPLVDGSAAPSSALISVGHVDDLGLTRLADLLRLSDDLVMIVTGTDTDSTIAQIHPQTVGTALELSESVSARATVATVGWQVIVRQNWADMVPPILRYEITIFLAVSMTVLAALLAFYFGMAGIATPLRRLDEAASRVGWGDFEAIHEPVGGVREIEELRLALARMADQVRRYQEELQSYIGAMTTGQEEERKRVARELHDDTVQSLIALNQQVEMIQRQLQKNPGIAAKRLQDLRPLITDTIAGVRRQIHDLRPLYLEDLGFVPALEMLVRQMGEHNDLAVSFRVEANPERRLPASMEISAYRIVQEALRNVALHAGASQVTVTLVLGENEVELRIQDDGQGFAVPEHPYLLAEYGHYGLLGMQERAQQHGGRLRIESELGDGVTVTVTLPITEGDRKLGP